jgi:predicted GNAT family acetyltransferase
MSDNAALVVHHSTVTFATAVREFLERGEAEYLLLLSTLDLVQASGNTAAPLMAVGVANGQVTAAAMCSNTHLIVAGRAAAVSESLANALLERRIDIPGVIGPAHDADVTSEAWSRVRRCQRLLSMEQGLYQLTRVSQPDGTPGAKRPMTVADIDLVAKWHYEFVRESMPHRSHSIEASTKNAADRPEKGLTYLWDVAGAPVAMGALARQTKNGIAVNAVYTPPEQRRKGYATALVAALSEEGLRRYANVK